MIRPQVIRFKLKEAVRKGSLSYFALAASRHSDGSRGFQPTEMREEKSRRVATIESIVVIQPSLTQRK